MNSVPEHLSTFGKYSYPLNYQVNILFCKLLLHQELPEINVGGERSLEICIYACNVIFPEFSLWVPSVVYSKLDYIVESYLLFCLVDFFEERLLTFDRQLLTFYPEVVQFIENHIPGVGKGLLGKHIFAIAVGAFVGHPSDEAFC